jgi:hypothetical protein
METSATDRLPNCRTRAGQNLAATLGNAIESILTQLCSPSVLRLTLENPKIVGWFYLSVMALALAITLTLSVLGRSLSPLLWMLGIIAGLVALSLIFTVLFGPLLWLLSRLSGRNHHRGPSLEEKRR